MEFIYAYVQRVSVSVWVRWTYVYFIYKPIICTINKFLALYSDQTFIYIHVIDLPDSPTHFYPMFKTKRWTRSLMNMDVSTRISQTNMYICKYNLYTYLIIVIDVNCDEWSCYILHCFQSISPHTFFIEASIKTD